MYEQSAGAAGRRGGYARRAGDRRDRRGLAARERARLVQLGVCGALFLTLFLGKGVFPGRVARLQERLQGMIAADTDFRAAFSALGEALADRGPVLGELGELCVEVFGGGDQAREEVAMVQSLARTESGLLSRQTGAAELAAHYLRLDQVPESWFSGQTAAEPADSNSHTAEPAAGPAAQSSAPAVGTVLLKADYTGQPLPENYTMDQISLGALETVSPILGRLRSGYGYRDHPVDGAYKFHNGVDIGGQQGEAIGAFADGTVDYIGENDTHGLYLQLDHGNGIKSFYAHCSKLCVSKGQPVAAGEKIAEVGSTGVATGPHLHLELKYNGLHLNPAYYVDFLGA